MEALIQLQSKKYHISAKLMKRLFGKNAERHRY